MERTRYPKEFKEQVLREARESGNIAQTAKRHGLAPSVVYDWISASKRKAFEAAPPSAKKVNAYQPSAQEYRRLEDENEALKKLIGEKELEIQILRDLTKKSNPGYRTSLR